MVRRFLLLVLVSFLLVTSAFTGMLVVRVLSARADQNHSIVDIADVCAVRLAFGSQPGDPRWNQYADINGDHFVRVDDMLAVAIHYGLPEA